MGTSVQSKHKLGGANPATRPSWQALRCAHGNSSFKSSRRKWIKCSLPARWQPYVHAWVSALLRIRTYRVTTDAIASNGICATLRGTASVALCRRPHIAHVIDRLLGTLSSLAKSRNRALFPSPREDFKRELSERETHVKYALLRSPSSERSLAFGRCQGR